MQSTQTFILRLKNACRNPDILAIYRQQTQKHLATAGGSFRLFDSSSSEVKLVPLLTRQELSDVTDELRADISEIKIDYDLDHMPSIKGAGKNSIKKWLTMLAQQGCSELLNADGLIKNELCELLGWQNLINEEKSAAIVCAYVSNVCQDVIDEIQSDFSDDTKTALMLCITQHYANCVSGVFKKYGWEKGAAYLYQQDPSIFQFFKQLSTEEKVIGSVVAVGAVATLVAAGMFLFKAFSDNKQIPEESKGYHP